MAILFSGILGGEINQWKKDPEGRVVSVQISFSNTNYNLVNVYAPVNQLERSNYFQSVHQFFYHIPRLLLAVISIVTIAPLISFVVIFV